MVETIDEYISEYSKDIQEILKKIRKTIKEVAPNSEERIRWGMPTFYQKENLVHFAVNKKHIGFYPSPSGIENFKEELSSYKTSKGAAQFPYDRPIPYELIKKITQFRVNEAENK
ncbi:hypothetical protein SDC9_17130 [bioreactor metagenome]|uniref:YdhG-like domain-containing protein n=1 Tax=bioreactor metagenome TaxID=1076179 RepID=A0A644TWN4_9ZZZZ|nr:DUF1801 domain-containing protein [Methanobrevibacter sp.]MEA4956586.1 DUF1801 domain-containing protein [Methanobrevibacter sp.]